MAGAGAAGAGVPAPPGRRAETAAHRRARRQRSDLRHVNWLLKLVAADGMHHTSEAKLTGLVRRWCAPGQGGDSTGGMGAAPPGGVSIRESVQAVVLDPYVGAGTPGARAAQRQAAGDSGSPGVGPPAAQAAQRQVHSTMGSSGAGATSAFAGSCQARLVLQYVDGVVSAQVFQGQAAGEVATPGVGAPAAPAVPLPGVVRPWVGHLGDVGMADAAVGDSMGAEPSADLQADDTLKGTREDAPLREFGSQLVASADRALSARGDEDNEGGLSEEVPQVTGTVLNVLRVDERARALQMQTAAEGPAGVRRRLGTELGVDERLLWAHLRASFPVLAEECSARGAAKGAGADTQRYAFEIARIAFPAQFAFAAELCGFGDG